MTFFDDSKSNIEVMEFLEKCFLFIQDHRTWKRQLLEKATVDFSHDVKKAFLDLLEKVVFSGAVKREKDKIIFTLDETYSYRRRLVLYAGDSNLNNKFDKLNFEDAQVIRAEDGYQLICLAENYKQETEFPITIFFDQAAAEIETFRADRRTFGSNPWETISLIAFDILEKSDLGEKYFNQKEKKLLPLLREIRALSNWAPLFEDEQIEFALIKQYVQDCKLDHLIPLLDEAGEKYPNLVNRGKLLSKLTNKLNEAVCEPLWRKLYELLADSQQSYAEQIPLYNNSELQKIRTKIQEQLKSFGYEGEYPNFYKSGATKRLHLEESYGLSYFIGMGKKVEYRIQCIENNLSGQFQIQFLCGTAFLRKDEKVKDIYSCCFNAKGRRLFKTVYFQKEASDTLEQTILIAVKKTECIKLNREEKKSYYGENIFGWRYFVLIFLFIGGLFAVLMTAAMFLICVLVTAVTVGIGEIPSMISEMPWWLLFGIAFVGFGGAMAVVEIKVKTK